MSKTTQENPAVENSTVETVSNTSKSTTRSRKSTGTAVKSTTAATKPARSTTRAAGGRSKTAAATTTTTTKPRSTVKTKVQQDKTMSQNTVRRVAIIGGNRIPFARSNGAYFTASNIDMFTAALNGLAERFNLKRSASWRSCCRCSFKAQP